MASLTVLLPISVWPRPAANIGGDAWRREAVSSRASRGVTEASPPVANPQPAEETELWTAGTSAYGGNAQTDMSSPPTREPAPVQEPHSLIRAKPCPTWCVCAQQKKLRLTGRHPRGHAQDTGQKAWRVLRWSAQTRHPGGQGAERSPVSTMRGKGSGEASLRIKCKREGNGRGKRASLCWLKPRKGETTASPRRAHAKATRAPRARAGAGGWAMAGRQRARAPGGKSRPGVRKKLPGCEEKAAWVWGKSRPGMRKKPPGCEEAIRGGGGWQGGEAPVGQSNVAEGVQWKGGKSCEPRGNGAEELQPHRQPWGRRQVRRVPVPDPERYPSSPPSPRPPATTKDALTFPFLASSRLAPAPPVKERRARPRGAAWAAQRPGRPPVLTLPRPLRRCRCPPTARRGA